MKHLQSSEIKKNISAKIHPILLYALEDCPYCKSAIALLEEHKLKYNKIIVENNEKSKEKYKKMCKMNTFPMIFIRKSDDEKKYIQIGGFSDLQKYIQLIQHLEEHHIDINVMKSLSELL